MISNLKGGNSQLSNYRITSLASIAHTKERMGWTSTAGAVSAAAKGVMQIQPPTN